MKIKIGDLLKFGEAEWVVIDKQMVYNTLSGLPERVYDTKTGKYRTGKPGMKHTGDWLIQSTETGEVVQVHKTLVEKHRVGSIFDAVEDTPLNGMEV